MKKKLITLIGVPALVTIVGLILKNPSQYSNRWFSKLSEDELKNEREKVRKEYCEAKDDRSASILFDLLDVFDREIRKRKSDDGEIGYPVHSEHGWYLESDD